MKWEDVLGIGGAAIFGTDMNKAIRNSLMAAGVGAGIGMMGAGGLSLPGAGAGTEGAISPGTSVPTLSGLPSLSADPALMSAYGGPGLPAGVGAATAGKSAFAKMLPFLLASKMGGQQQGNMPAPSGGSAPITQGTGPQPMRSMMGGYRPPQNPQTAALIQQLLRRR